MSKDSVSLYCEGIEDGCEQCQSLIDKYGKENIFECSFCGHLFYPKNGCRCGKIKPEKKKVFIFR